MTAMIESRSARLQDIAISPPVLNSPFNSLKKGLFHDRNETRLHLRAKVPRSKPSTDVEQMLVQQQLGSTGKSIDNVVADLFDRRPQIVNGRKGAAHMRCQFLAAPTKTEDRRKGCWELPGRTVQSDILVCIVEPKCMCKLAIESKTLDCQTLRQDGIVRV